MTGSLILALCVAFATGQVDATAPAAPEPLPELAAESDAVDVLTRGPVHEAFAEQVNGDPKPGIVAPKAPPADVNELPPDIKPEGDDVVWIPGYWFWDDDHNDYVWVSGVWRRMPPERRWVPGYWQEIDGQYQWVPGFWKAQAQPEMEYVEPPPANLEAGPSSPAPSDDHFWVPGNWTYLQSQYRWRPGYWYQYRPDWTWVCDRYVWTPRGCVFIRGYWDYPLTRRGCLFAPVYFRRPIYLEASYSYQPRCSIGYDSLLLHLFVRPRSYHYYFGDYYAASYRSRYYACYDYFSRYRGYDPLYTYYDHYYRGRGINYVDRVRQWHHYYARHQDLRPLHTWGAQRRYGANPIRGHDRRRSYSMIGRDLHQSLARNQLAWKAERLRPEQLAAYRRDSSELRRLAGARKRLELPIKDAAIRHPRTGDARASAHHISKVTLPQLGIHRWPRNGSGGALAKKQPTTHPGGKQTAASPSRHASPRHAGRASKDPRGLVGKHSSRPGANDALRQLLDQPASKRAAKLRAMLRQNGPGSKHVAKPTSGKGGTVLHDPHKNPVRPGKAKPISGKGQTVLRAPRKNPIRPATSKRPTANVLGPTASNKMPELRTPRDRPVPSVPGQAKPTIGKSQPVSRQPRKEPSRSGAGNKIAGKASASPASRRSATLRDHLNHGPSSSRPPAVRNGGIGTQPGTSVPRKPAVSQPTVSVSKRRSSHVPASPSSLSRFLSSSTSSRRSSTRSPAARHASSTPPIPTRPATPPPSVRRYNSSMSRRSTAPPAFRPRVPAASRAKPRVTFSPPTSRRSAPVFKPPTSRRPPVTFKSPAPSRPRTVSRPPSTRHAAPPMRAPSRASSRPRASRSSAARSAGRSSFRSPPGRRGRAKESDGGRSFRRRR